MQKQLGFTLIELMVVIVILSILTMIALPSYNAYARRANESQAEQQMQNLAMQLDRHKARQFNYVGFADASASPVVVPIGSVGSAIKYKISIKDGGASNPLLTEATATGLSWIMKAESEADGELHSYLLTSTGVRCKNKLKANISMTGCGVGGEIW